MTKKQSNYYRMLMNTQNFFDDHSSIWDAIPAIVAIKNDLDEIISRIGETSEAATADSKGVTERKKQVLNTLALKTSSLSGTLQAYAHAQDDMDLLKHIKVSKSDILTMPETQVPAKVMTVVKAARERLEGLTDYAVTEEMLVEIESSVEEFNPLIGKPKSIRNNKFAALSDIQQLFDAAGFLVLPATCVGR